MKSNTGFTEKNICFTEKIFALPLQDLEGKMMLSTKYLLYHFLLYIAGIQRERFPLFICNSDLEHVAKKRVSEGLCVYMSSVYTL